MIILIWPLVILFTLMLYFLILVTLPFNSTTATVFLFTLMGFWSRLPGVGIPAPFWILYVADVIDVLAMIIAINVGGIYGGLMSLFANLGGRACGAFTHWGGNISDAIAMFFTCLVIPSIHTLLGGSLFLTMIAFMTIRITLIVPLDRLGLYQVPWPQYIAEWVGAGTALYFINGFYTKVFGEFFDNLLESGAAFSWPLFIFATIVILTSYLIMFAFSKSPEAVKRRKDSLGLLKMQLHRQKEKIGTKKERRASTQVKEGNPDKGPEAGFPESDRATENKEKEDGTLISSVETIKKGCPFCRVDVKGNDNDGFYCPECNMIYRREDLQLRQVDEEEN